VQRGRRAHEHLFVQGPCKSTYGAGFMHLWSTYGARLTHLRSTYGAGAKSTSQSIKQAPVAAPSYLSSCAGKLMRLAPCLVKCSCDALPAPQEFVCHGPFCWLTVAAPQAPHPRTCMRVRIRACSPATDSSASRSAAWKGCSW